MDQAFLDTGGPDEWSRQLPVEPLRLLSMPTVPRGSLCTPGKHQPLPSRLQGGSNTLSDTDLAKAPQARGRIGTKLQDAQGGCLGLGPLCVVGG